MRNIWCEKLRPIEICIFWCKSLLVPLIVHYDEYFATCSAAKVLAVAQRFNLCRNFVPANLDFSERDEAGCCLVYLANSHLTHCCETFLEQHVAVADERYRQMVKTYMRGYLERQIIFITYVDARIRRIGTQNNEIVVEPNRLNSTLSKFYAGRGLAVKSMFNCASVLRAWLVPIAYVAAHIVARIVPRMGKENIGVVRPSVWLEYSDGDRNELGFWIKYVDTSVFDIVYYFDRPDTPITETRTTKIEQRGLKWIDGHLLPLFQLANIPLHVLAGSLLRAISPVGAPPLWFRAFRFQERMWYHTHLAVFRKFQVKILIQHQDRDWRQAVQAHAIEDAGGIMLGYHWSNLPYCLDTYFLTSQHIYFVWGQAMLDCLRRKGNTCRHILPSGIWLKRTSEEKPVQLNELALDLDFVLSIYDSDIAHGFLMPTIHTPETLSAFFICILDLLESNPRWGAFLKFKNRTLGEYHPILPRGTEIVGRMKKLIQEGRLVELDVEISPITVAENSDLAVCYALNTAGIVSGIFGHPAIHWDCVGLHHPLYDDPDQKILVASLEELAGRIRRAAEGDKAIGDFSKWLKDYNSFLDFQGDKRIAMFIQAYMDLIVSTNAPDQCLASVVKHYMEANQLTQ